MTEQNSFYQRENWGLPDPRAEAAFYEGTPTKRLIAWIIDSVITGLITFVIITLSAFLLVLIYPLIFFGVNAVYRYVTLARGSATLGMRLVALEFRTHRGARFDNATAFFHTLGYLISTSMVIPQIISIAMMLTTERGQGLTDSLLGTAPINRLGRH